jgi:hypothetical protein
MVVKPDDLLKKCSIVLTWYSLFNDGSGAPWTLTVSPSIIFGVPRISATTLVDDFSLFSVALAIFADVSLSLAAPL